MPSLDQARPASSAEDVRREIQAYLDAFAKELTAGNARALADLWETPALVLGDDMVLAVNDHQEVEDFFGGAKAQYNERGITDTKAQIEKLDMLTPRMAIVRVRWPYLDANGKEVGAESSTYTLRKDDGGDWRLRVSMMHGVEKPH